MKIKQIRKGKWLFKDLLMEADEQESMIEKYINIGDMFVVENEKGIVAECIVVKISKGVYELKNIAVKKEFRKMGYGKILVNHAFNLYKDLETMYVGTGDSPCTVEFYKKCGFNESHRVKGFFTENYDHKIYECGKLLKDMVYFKKNKIVD